MITGLAAATLLANSSFVLSAQPSGYHHYISPNAPGWERFDVMLTNTTDEARELSVCPSAARMTSDTVRSPKFGAFAISFDEEDWTFNCSTRSLAPGEKVEVGMFFRLQAYQSRNRSIALETNLGSFVLDR